MSSSRINANRNTPANKVDDKAARHKKPRAQKGDKKPSFDALMKAPEKTEASALTKAEGTSFKDEMAPLTEGDVDAPLSSDDKLDTATHLQEHAREGRELGADQHTRQTFGRHISELHQERRTEHDTTREHQLDARQAPEHTPDASRAGARLARAASSSDEDPAQQAQLGAQEEVTGVGTGANASKAQDVEAPRASTSERAEAAELAKKLVKACYVGQDNKARRVTILDVNVPGRGQMRVRLRQSAQGMEVRMRADNPELTTFLKQNTHNLRDQASSQGINFARIDVVSS